MPNLANKLKPLRELLNKATTWKWTDKCETAFKDVTTALAKSEAVTHFDPNLPLQLACDASPYEVGAVMSHIMPSGEERLISFASRTLSKAESNYTQIKCEALSIVFGVKKFHQYLFGRKFTLLTDHQPQTSIFGPHTGIPSQATSRSNGLCCYLPTSTRSSIGSQINIRIPMGFQDSLCLSHTLSPRKLRYFTSRMYRLLLSPQFM